MGLDIKKFSYSYGTFNRMRELVIQKEGNYKDADEMYNTFNEVLTKGIKTKFPNFLLHCDCDGIYLSKSSKQYKKYYDKYKPNDDRAETICMVGDLDELKKECKEIDSLFDVDSWLNNLLEPWKDFYDDVKSSRKILIFR